MPSDEFQPGDWVIYTMPKRSRHPGPRARSVHPAQLGDDYSYVVDKFWVVVEVQSDSRILIRTRRGKIRTVRRDDPLLRKPRWWERWRHRNRFPGLNDVVPNSDSENQSASSDTASNN